jgi:RNA polymerase sigma factor (sigma-70 family)
MTTSFESLLDQVRHGSEEAAWQLIEEYGSHILSVVRRQLDREMRARLDSQDLVQAVWKSFFTDRDRMEAIVSPQQLIAFLASMARNKVIDEFRRNIRTSKRDIEREDGEIRNEKLDYQRGRDPTPSQVAIARERWSSMLAERSNLHQQIIRLRLSGASFEAIATQLEINERTARRVIDQLWQERQSGSSRTVAGW